MKKHLIIFLFVLIISPSVISAQSSLPDAGLLPDSSFYFFKSWKESIQLFFTFNAENKAKQYLHLAEVRLAEYQKMIEKGKSDIAEKTLAKYQNQLNSALAKAEEIKQKGKNIKDLSQQIEQATSKHLEVLQQNLEKVPEAAKKGIEIAIENSQKGIERVLEVKMDKEEKNREEKQEELKSDNETSNWETYRNEKYGFEVKYPLESDDLIDYDSEELFGISKGEMIDPYDIFNIEVDENKNRYSLEDIYKQRINNASIGLEFHIEKILQLNAIRYGGNSYERAEILKNNLIITLSTTGSRQDEFDKILSTFKFINQ